MENQRLTKNSGILSAISFIKGRMETDCFPVTDFVPDTAKELPADIKELLKDSKYQMFRWSEMYETSPASWSVNGRGIHFHIGTPYTLASIDNETDDKRIVSMFREAAVEHRTQLFVKTRSIGGDAIQYFTPVESDDFLVHPETLKIVAEANSSGILQYTNRGLVPRHQSLKGAKIRLVNPRPPILTF